MEAAVEKSSKVGNNCFIGKRHLVALMCFFICTLLNYHRIVIAVSIVAMVKQKQIDGKIRDNTSELSCPVNLETGNTTSLNLGGDLDWSPELQGYILGMSFLAYTLTQVPGGRWAESWGAKRVIVTSNMMAALFTFVTPMATWWNAYAVIAVQFVKGLVQGVCTPAVFVLMANWFPRSERGVFSTFVLAGLSAGVTLGGVVTGWLCDEPRLGWPAAFYVCGAFSAIVSLLFVFVICETPQSHPTITEEELKYITEGQESDLSEPRPPTPWRKMFTSLPVYALALGQFGQFWAAAQFLTVHPTYMGTILHFSMTENGAASTIPVCLKLVGGLMASVFTNWITKNKYMSINVLRKTCNSIGTLGFALCLLGVYFAGCDHLINIICFLLALFCAGFALSGAMIASGDMSTRFSGSLMGIASSFASTAHFIIPVVTGNLTKNQTIEEWHAVFFISIAVVLGCGLFFIVFGSADIQTWNDPETKLPEVFRPRDFELENQKSVVKN